MEEPLVSVHMITYNHEPYIRKAIECVLAQKTNFSFELIIGEDCSTDGTRDIVFDYQKKHPDIIRVITSENNVGAKKNNYRTTQACRGKYIAYCEGDDYWQREDKLQMQVDYLESHPECGLVYSDHDRFFVENSKTIKNFCRTTNNIPPQNFNAFRGWGPYHILTCTVMARKRIVDSIIVDPVIYLNERHIGGTDIPLFIEISMVSKIHYVDESLSTYAVQVESASNVRNPGRKARFVRSNIEAYLYLAKKYGYEEERRYFEQCMHRAQLWVAFWEKDLQLARDLKKNNWIFSIKEWILYVGVTNFIIHFFLRVTIAAYVKWKSKSEYRRWKRYAV